MKKRRFLWLVVASLALGVLITFVFGFQSLNATKMPKISFDERIYDFGVVSREDLPHHRFTFNNTGQADLIISEVDSSCGCTAALLSAGTIPPGGRGEIDVSFNPQGRRGKQKQTVLVYSNAENEPIVQLTVKGIVMAAVDVSPDRVLFGSVNNQEVATKHLRVLDSGEGTLKITHIETSSPFLTTEVGPVRLDKVINYEVKVTLHLGVPMGNFQEILTIYTNNELQPHLSVAIEGNVLGPITVHPEHLFFGFVNRQKLTQQDILLTKTDGADLKVLEVGHQSQFVSTEIVSIENGRQIRVRVTVSRDTPSGPFRDLLEIYTNNTEQSVIQVPLHALLRK